MLVVGEKEAESGTVAIRCRKPKDKAKEGTMALDDFLKMAVEEVRTREK